MVELPEPDAIGKVFVPELMLELAVSLIGVRGGGSETLEPIVDVDVERRMREGFTGRLMKRLDWTDRSAKEKGNH